MKCSLFLTVTSAVLTFLSGGGGHGQVDTRGGQLQIAGVVVGNWGPNMQSSSGRPGGRGTHVAPPPQVTSVGPKR